MSEPNDPPRIVDPDSGVSVRLKHLVERSRADIGSEGEVRTLEAKLSPMLWPGGGPPGSPGTAAGSVGAKAGAALALKVGAALIVAGAGGFWLASRHPAEPEAGAPRAVSLGTGIAPVAVPAPAVTTATEVAAPSAPPPTLREHGSQMDSVSESDLLDRAQASLANNPSQALSLTARHRHLFPHGALAQEREVIAIEALTRLGWNADAKARADRFLVAFPGSAYRNKVRSLVGVE